MDRGARAQPVQDLKEETRWQSAHPTPDGAVGVALMFPQTGPAIPKVFVASNVGDPDTPSGNLVVVNKYDVNGTLIGQSKPWGGTGDPRRRAVSIKGIQATSLFQSHSVNFVCVLVEDVEGVDKTDVVVLVYDENLSLEKSLQWSYQPFPGFHGRDIPVAMDVKGKAFDNTVMVYIAVAVKSENAVTHSLYDTQTLLWSGGNGAIGAQAFDNSRVSFAGASSIPVGVSVMPPNGAYPANPAGCVAVAGTVQPTNGGDSSIFAMGYCIDRQSSGGSPGDPVPYLATGPRRWFAAPGTSVTAMAMAADGFTDNVGYGENMYVTGFTPDPISPTHANWVTIKWRSEVTSPFAMEYNGVAGLDDIPRAIEVRLAKQTGTGDDYNHHYFWVAGTTQTANGTTDVALVQYEDTNGNGFGEDWHAQLFTDATLNQGNFDRDDVPIALTSAEDVVPGLDDAHANVFVTARSLSAGGTWDYLTAKYNSAFPIDPRKHEDWAILGSDSTRGGSPTNGVAAGAAVYPWTLVPGIRSYYKVFTSGVILDPLGSGDFDSMTIKHCEKLSNQCQ